MKDLLIPLCVVYNIVKHPHTATLYAQFFITITWVWFLSHKKKSNGVKSHDLGGQFTLLDMSLLSNRSSRISNLAWNYISCSRLFLSGLKKSVTIYVLDSWQYRSHKTKILITQALFRYRLYALMVISFLQRRCHPVTWCIKKIADQPCYNVFFLFEKDRTQMFTTYWEVLPDRYFFDFKFRGLVL